MASVPVKREEEISIGDFEKDTPRVRNPKRGVSITAKVEKISPQLALKWLEDTEKSEEVRNRGISENNVRLFAESMVRGAWEISHQGIAIYRHGGRWVILDGQHRMWAIVQAGVSVNMMVSRYEEGTIQEAMEIMKTFDRGQRRNLGQVLKISDNIERGSTRAAVARYLILFLRSGGDGQGYRRVIDADIIAAVHEYQRDLDWFVTLKRRAGNVFLSAPVGAVLVYAHSIPEHSEAVERYGAQLSGGEGLYAGNPALTFRDWVLTRPGGSDSLLRRPEGRMMFMRVAFTALAKGIQGRTAQRLADNLEGFEFFRQAKSKKKG